MAGQHDPSGRNLVSTPVFSEGAENPTRGRVGYPKRKKKDKGKYAIICLSLYSGKKKSVGETPTLLEYG
jgi:hypothetical protein